MKKYGTLFVIVGGLILGTVAGLWLFRRSVHRPAPPPERLRELSAATAGAQPPHARGEENSPITLEEFGDFQCPPCARLHPVLKEIERDYGGRVRFVHRHFPLDIHQHAMPAALAAEAAARQGKFWEMLDLLYERQPEWGQAEDAKPKFKEYALALGLDVEKFARDSEAGELRERVQADRRRGETAGVDATPTLFLNGRELPPEAMTAEGIRAAIEAALPQKSRSND